MWKANYKAGYAIGILYLLSFVSALWLYGLDLSGWLTAYTIHFFIFSFGVSFGLHKATAHQLAPSDQWLVRLAVMTGVLSNTGSPVDFIITHRLHHDHADTGADPQNSADLGWRLLFGMRVDAADPVGQLYASRTILRDPFFLWIHNYYYLIIIVYIGLAFAIGGLRGLLFGALIPGGLSFFGLGALNYWGHSRFGYQNHLGNGAKNVWWLLPLIFGESWHNNHHARPGVSNYRNRPWEVDPSAIYFHITSPRSR